jgi:hypothetical protein
MKEMETNVQVGFPDRRFSMTESTKDIPCIPITNAQLVESDIVSAVAMETIRQRSFKIDDHKQTEQQNCKLYII